MAGKAQRARKGGRLEVRIDETLHEKVRQYAWNKGRTVSEVVTTALRAIVKAE